jgi:hypothetical protein
VEPFAWTLIAVCLVLKATVFRFQHYTLNAAGRVVWAEGGTRNPADVAKVQSLITSGGMVSLALSSDILVAGSCIVVCLTWGFAPVVGLLAWIFVGGALLGSVWPSPTDAQSAELVNREVHRGLARLIQAGAASSPEFRLLAKVPAAAMRNTPAAR